MKNNLTLFIYRFFEIIVFIILFFAPFFGWYNNNDIVFGHDLSYYINPNFDFSRDFFSLWTNHFNGVVLSNQGSILLDFLSYIFKDFNYLWLRIIQSFIFILPIISFYYFVSIFVDSTFKNKIYILIGSLLYGFNFFVIQRLHEVQFIFLINYGLLPLFLRFYYQFLTNKKIKYLILSLLITLLNAVNYSDPPSIIGYWGFAFLIFSLLTFFLKKEHIKNWLYYTFVFIIVNIATLAFVFIPLFFVVIDVSNKEFMLNNVGLDYVNLSSQQEGLLGLFRQMGYFLLYSITNRGEPIYEFIKYYNTSFLIFSVFFVICLVFMSFLLTEKGNTYRFLSLFSGISIIIGLLFANGIQYPTGGIFKFFFTQIPFFWMFRSPDNKMYPLYLLGISISIVLFFVYSKIHDNIKKVLAILVILSILVYSFPIFLGLVPQERHRISIPYEYLESSNYINNQKTDFNVLFINRIHWGEFFLAQNKSYRGINLIDPLLEKGVIWNPADSYSYKRNSDVYRSFFYNNTYKFNDEFSPFANIKFFILSKDLDYEFYNNYPDKNYEERSLDFYRKMLNNSHIIIENKNLIIYKISSDRFLPRIYTPKTVIVSNQSIEFLPEIISMPNYQIRSAIYLEDQNKESSTLIQKLHENLDNTPVLEFKKINPTKYRVTIHNATESFPLVFSESLHDGWKTYLVEHKETILDTNILNNYKILDGNGADQATKEELIKFINNGWITSLGNNKEKQIGHKKWESDKEVLDYTEKYHIDFISKNFQDTIQNDNLPDGDIYETWFMEPIENNENHLIANGYANSWIIDPTKLCDQNIKCIKNPDGSYDFEIVVEFWPQRLYYIGLIISGATFLVCMGYLIFDWRRNRTSRYIEID